MPHRYPNEAAPAHRAETSTTGLPRGNHRTANNESDSPAICRPAGAPDRGGAVLARDGPGRAIRLSRRRAVLSRLSPAPAGWACRPADPRAPARTRVAVSVRSLGSWVAPLVGAG